MEKAVNYVEKNNLFNDFFLKEESSGKQIRDEIEKTIKQAQIDAVEYAVKMCAEDANLNRELEDSGSGIIDVHEIYAYDVFYKNGTVTVNKESILNVEDKIKKEINGNTEKNQNKG